LTNGFSKKLENHLHMLSLYFVHYNFVRVHESLRMTPAMAAGVTDTLHDMEWIVGLIDARAPAPKKRGPCKKRNSNRVTTRSPGSLTKPGGVARPARADRVRSWSRDPPETSDFGCRRSAIPVPTFARQALSAAGHAPDDVADIVRHEKGPSVRTDRDADRVNKPERAADRGSVLGLVVLCAAAGLGLAIAVGVQGRLWWQRRVGVVKVGRGGGTACVLCAHSG